MIIQKVHMKDFSSVMKLFKKVKKDLNKQKNDQWKWIYPTRFDYKDDLKNGTMYGITEGDELIAVVTLDDIQSKQFRTLSFDDKEGRPCCIHRLAVDPDHQGKGIGKFLLQFIENSAMEKGYTSVRIEVYMMSEPARSLYKRNGYKEVGETYYAFRKHPYISMEKRLR